MSWRILTTCSQELSPQAQLWHWRHEVLAEVWYLLMTAAHLPQTRVQPSTVQGTVHGCMACDSQGDLHCSTWSGQSDLCHHGGVECNAQYGSGSLNSHRFLCSIPTHLLTTWGVKRTRCHQNFYPLSKLLPAQAALSVQFFLVVKPLRSVTSLTQTEKENQNIRTPI